MSLCVICDCRYYSASYDGPAEPCVCGHGVSGESAWRYAGVRGVAAQFKYRVLRKAFDKLTHTAGNWLYTEWK